jgi:hypothetical protein
MAEQDPGWLGRRSSCACGKLELGDRSAQGAARQADASARGGEEHWLAHSCGQSVEIASEEMRPLAVRSETKSEER